nr:cache domain-containing protein [Candidatus Omnitrophota bacterium]
HIIKNDIIARAQSEIRKDLFIAGSVLYGEIEAIKSAFNIIPLTGDLEKVRESLGLDYLYIVDIADASTVRSEIVKKAFRGLPAGGIRVIKKDELLGMGMDVYRKCEIDVRPTPRSHIQNREVLDEAMAIGYAVPVFGDTGEVKKVLYGGKILNRNFSIVDKIRDLVFRGAPGKDGPGGTVTIFLDGIRVTTNVMDAAGNRAIGTMVSGKVYDMVVREGKSWLDRAFVVTDWYLTAYEPIRNIEGDVVGILYVGIPEKPFRDMEKRILFDFIFIVIVVALLAALSSYILAYSISRPVKDMLDATKKISLGDLGYRMRTDTDIVELKRLADAFNEMTARLEERQKSYLDLVGFVSHELKGILSSAILNVYSVRGGFLGLINFKQTKAMDSVSRNLDYLDATVKNFLNLSRIEKGEMSPNLSDILVKENVFDVAVEAFSRAASDKGITVKNMILPGITARADLNLFQIVANNLVGNAIKYGRPGGEVILRSYEAGDGVQLEIYNDGRPITDSERPMLFRKFSRLDATDGKKVQGTGLGLFIVREIVERHGWEIWSESIPSGNFFKIKIRKGGIL